jgi:DNA-binding NtrC family response regulator
MGGQQKINQKHILLIDDDLSVRILFSRLLEKEGYLVTAVKDGYEGIKAIERQKFDLALVDVVMPGMDGIEVLENIKKRRSHLPVVIYTAHGSAETFAEAMKKGAVDCLTKPFSVQELTITISRILGDDKS